MGVGRNVTLRTVLKDQKQIGESAEYFCVYTALSDNKFVMLECPWLAS